MQKLNMKLSLIRPGALPPKPPRQENFTVMNFLYSVFQVNYTPGYTVTNISEIRTYM
jgi:hypothetical protein